MKAVISERYGSPDILELRQIPKPEPKAGEVLVKVHATTVTRTDLGMLRAKPFIVRFFDGLRKPKHTILGMDFAGTVEATGPNVTSFEPGMRVFGLSPNEFGCHAEYVCVSEKGAIAVIPDDFEFAEAVVCEGAWYADNYLQALRMQPGDSILIYGASGAIGTAAVQLAKIYGTEVTAVVSTRHLKLAASLGADRVVDYSAEDFTQLGQMYDYVLDAVGKTSYFQCRNLLKPKGVFAATDFGPWLQNPLLATWSAISRSRRVLFPLPKGSESFVPRLKTMMAAGAYHAVIDREYSLDEIAEAYRYVETGEKAGIVVVDIASGESFTT